MSLVYEDLYRNETFANIKFLNYAKNLSGNLLRSYSDMQGKIKLVYDIEDVFLPMDTGIPCGLILNELITNSFKYAFKDREEGIITIRLTVIDTGKFLLEISDNGVGIDKTFDIENAKSMGLKIVNKLVQQIDGTIECDLSEGTKFIIKF